MKRKIPFLLILFFILVSSLFSETFEIKMVFMPLTALSGLDQKEAIQARDLIKVELINSQKVKLFDLTLNDQDILTKKEKNVSEIITLLGNTKADYILYGSVSKSNENQIISIFLINVHKQEEVLAISKKIRDIQEDYKDCAEDILNKIKDYHRTSIADIKAYVNTQSWPQAYSELKAWQSQNPDQQDNEIETLQIQIYSEMARLEYDKAKAFLESFKFSQARSHISRAINFAPEKEEYLQMQEGIETRFKEYQSQTEESMLKQINFLIVNGDIEAADDFLRSLEEDGFHSEACLKTRKKLDLELKAAAYYKTARRFYLRRKYITAKSEILKAQEIKPEEKSYIKLREKIERKMLAQSLFENKWSQVDDFFSRLHPYSLFLKKKKYSHFESLSLARNNYKYLDINSNYENSEIMKGFQLSECWHFTVSPFDWLMEKLDFNENFQLKLTSLGSMSWLWNSDQENTYVSLESALLKNTSFNWDISGTAGPSLEFLSFLFGVGMEVNLGVLSFSESIEVFRDSSLNTKTRNNHFTLGIGIGTWLAWIPDDKSQVFLHARINRIKIWGPLDSSQEKTRLGTLTIGFGRKFY